MIIDLTADVAATSTTLRTALDNLILALEEAIVEGGAALLDAEDSDDLDEVRPYNTRVQGWNINTLIFAGNGVREIGDQWIFWEVLVSREEISFAVGGKAPTFDEAKTEAAGQFRTAIWTIFTKILGGV